MSTRRGVVLYGVYTLRAGGTGAAARLAGADDGADAGMAAQAALSTAGFVPHRAVSAAAAVQTTAGEPRTTPSSTRCPVLDCV